MASNKIARINDDIQRVLSAKLRDIKDPRVQQGMISVTRVETTGDLRYSKIWLSVMGLKDEKEFRRGLKSPSKTHAHCRSTTALSIFFHSTRQSNHSLALCTPKLSLSLPKVI